MSGSARISSRRLVYAAHADLTSSRASCRAVGWRLVVVVEETETVEGATTVSVEHEDTVASASRQPSSRKTDWSDRNTKIKSTANVWALMVLYQRVFR